LLLSMPTLLTVSNDYHLGSAIVHLYTEQNPIAVSQMNMY